MPTGKIDDFIDEKAFQQFERLRQELSSSQQYFEKLVISTKNFNSALSNSKSVIDLSTNIDKANELIIKMNESQKTQVKQYSDVMNAYEAMIEVSNKGLASTEKSASVIDKLTRANAQLRIQSKAVSDARRDLNKAYQQGNITNEQFLNVLSKLESEQTKINAQRTENNRLIKDEQKSSEAAAGSYDQLNQQLRTNRKQYQSLSEEQRNNEEIGGKLLQTIQEQDKQLKELDETQGIYNRNVGNYKSALNDVTNVLGEVIPGFNSLSSEAQKGISVFNAIRNVITNFVSGTNEAKGSTEGFAAAEKAAFVSTDTLAKGLKILRIAFISTGIGAVIVLIASLITYFTKTQEGIDKINKILFPLQAIFRTLIKLGSDLGRNLVEAFSSPRKSLETILNFLKGQLINRLKAFAVIWEGIRNADFKTFNNGLIQMYTGITNASDRVEKLGKTFSDAWKSGQRVADIDKQIGEAEIELEKNRGRLNRQYEEQRELSQDLNASAKERHDASIKAMQANTELAALETNLQKLRIAQTKEEIKQKGEENLTDEEKMKLTQQQSALDDISASATRRNRRVKRQMQNQDAKAAKQSEADQLAEIQRLNQISEIRRQITQAQRQNEINNAKASADVNKVILDNENVSLEQRLQNLQLYRENRLKIIEISTDKEISDAQTSQKEIEDLRHKGLNDQADAEQELMEQNVERIKSKEKDLKIKLDQEIADSNFEIIKSNLDKRGATELQSIKDNARNEEIELKQQYAKGEITREQFEKSKTDIQSKYAKLQIETAINTAEKIIQAEQAAGIDTAAQSAKLAALRAQLAEDLADKEIFENERSAQTQEERQRQLVNALKRLANEAFDFVNVLVQGSLQRQLNSLDVQKQALDDKYNADKERIEQSTQDETQRQQLLMQLDKQRSFQNEQIADRERKIKQKQASAQKIADITRIIGNTAIGITSALAMFPPNIPLSIIVGAIGALQLGKVLATPVPQFFKGTESSPEGFATVGEKGSEMFVTPEGKLGLTPSKTTLTYLQKGTKIIDADNTRRLMAFEAIEGVKNDSVMTLFSNAAVDRIVNAIINKKEIRENISIDENGFRRWTEKGISKKRWINKKVY